MNIQRSITALFAVLFFSQASVGLAQGALEQSCKVLGVMGGNQADRLAPVFTEVTSRWPDQNRDSAIEQFSTMLEQVEFAGGSVYEVARLGGDFAEHLIILRLAEGETAGMLLNYEWAPEGMALTRLNFKLDYVNELGISLTTDLDAEICP